MKRLILTASFCFIATSGWSAISVVQVSSGVIGTTPRTVNFNSTNSGELLVVAAMLTNTTRFPTCTDSASNSLTELDKATSTNTVNTQQVYILYEQNVASGLTSVTCSLSPNGSFGGLWAWRLSGAATSSAFDVATSSQIAVANTTLTGAPLTSTGANEIVIAADADSGSSTNANAPYTFDLGTAGGHGTAHHISGTQIVAESVQFTGASGTGCVSMAAFCPSGGCISSSTGGSYGKLRHLEADE